MNKKGQLSFQSYIVGILLAGLFIVALYNFSTGVSTNYQGTNLTVDSNLIDLDSLETQLNETSTDAKTWEERFTSDNIFVATGSIVLFSIWGVMKLIWTSINTITTIYFEGVHNVLGIDPLVTGVLSAILIVGLIFAGWRAIKTGE